MTTVATPAYEPADAPPPAEPQRGPGLVFPVAVLALYWVFWLVWRSLEVVTFARFAGRALPALLLTLVLAVWWRTRRRVSWAGRLGVAAVFLGAAVLTAALTKNTIGTFGLILTAPPLVVTAGVLWLVASRQASGTRRVAGLAATVAAAWLAFTLVRIEGVWGEQQGQYHWRWTPSSEDLYLAERSRGTNASTPATRATTAPAPALRVGPFDSPAYLGAGRDGVVRGVTLSDDWATHPPRQRWKRRVGPAWSSLIVVGNRLFTQEQQGDAEAVVCLDADTGSEVWVHRDENVRFWESVGGAGPRATPSYASGRVYTVGATGLLNCLDAATGARVWSRDTPADAGGAPVPTWGVSGSPLVVGDKVVAYAGGSQGKSLLAYDAGDGHVVWTAPAGVMSYASPQPATLLGTDQVLMLSDRGLTSVDPATGAILWEHLAQTPNVPRAVQPVVVGPSQVLMASESDLGLVMLDVKREGSTWSVTQRWASKGLKPSINQVVVHEGSAYGFDGSIFACVELGGGAKQWKSGRYGRGQVLLVPDSRHLLVLAEDGRVVLLRAARGKNEEAGNFQALEGKTWNHPVLTGARLYARNAEEMVCFDGVTRE
jgi:outer membrane protein assembly factor BamB